MTSSFAPHYPHRPALDCLLNSVGTLPLKPTQRLFLLILLFFCRPYLTPSQIHDFTPPFTFLSLLIAYTRNFDRRWDNLERRRVVRCDSSDLMYECSTSMVQYQYPHHHNPGVQTLLYLRSAAQVCFSQIARNDQFISANNSLKFEANTLTTSSLIY